MLVVIYRTYCLHVLLGRSYIFLFHVSVDVRVTTSYNFMLGAVLG